jgi:hypothetical protein
VKALKKMGWATFWAIFIQTHPVTLDTVEPKAAARAASRCLPDTSAICRAQRPKVCIRGIEILGATLEAGSENMRQSLNKTMS